MSRLIMKLAQALLPPSRKAWGEAMVSEFAHLSDGQSGFALGCLGVSLRENVMTWEGWARLGFGLVLVLSLWLTAVWTWFLLNLVDPTESIGPKLLGNLTYLGFGFFPLALGLAALRAMRQPTDRFHLAQIGHSTVTRFLVIFGALQSILSVLAIISIFEFRARGETIETGFLIGLAMGTTLLSVSWYARKSARMMRNAGSFALLLSVACVGLAAIQNAVQPEVSGHNYLYTARFMAIFMFLTATAGALFTWMERPAQSFGQH
jgi:hypothetical protein